MMSRSTVGARRSPEPIFQLVDEVCETSKKRLAGKPMCQAAEVDVMALEKNCLRAEACSTCPSKIGRHARPRDGD